MYKLFKEINEDGQDFTLVQMMDAILSNCDDSYYGEKATFVQSLSLLDGIKYLLLAGHHTMS